MENNEMMNITEVTRLIEWLTHNGHTHEEACECVDYIASHRNLDDKEIKKETPPPTK